MVLSIVCPERFNELNAILSPCLSRASASHLPPSLYRFSLSIYSSFPFFIHLLLSFLLISALHPSSFPLLPHAINVKMGRKSCKQDHCCFPTYPETTDME